MPGARERGRARLVLGVGLFCACVRLGRAQAEERLIGWLGETHHGAGAKLRTRSLACVHGGIALSGGQSDDWRCTWLVRYARFARLRPATWGALDRRVTEQQMGQPRQRAESRSGAETGSAQRGACSRTRTSAGLHGKMGSGSSYVEQ